MYEYMTVFPFWMKMKGEKLHRILVCSQDGSCGYSNSYYILISVVHKHKVVVLQNHFTDLRSTIGYLLGNLFRNFVLLRNLVLRTVFESLHHRATVCAKDFPNHVGCLLSTMLRSHWIYFL